MSSVRSIAFSAELADARAKAAQIRKEISEGTAADALSLGSIRRELVPFELETPDRILRYYRYVPQSVAELGTYSRHIRSDGDETQITMEGIVDGVIARVRDKDGKAIFEESHKEQILQWDATVLLSLWKGLGGGQEEATSERVLEATAKK